MSWSPRITSSASLEPILASTIRRCRSPALLTLTSDRKSTRLNSSHSQISYAVFCLKKKKELAHSGRLTRELPALRRSLGKASQPRSAPQPHLPPETRHRPPLSPRHLLG